jgi:Glycosyl hydrolase family 26
VRRESGLQLIGSCAATVAIVGLLVASAASAAERRSKVALTVWTIGSGTVRAMGHSSTCRAKSCRHTFLMPRGKRIVVTAVPKRGWKLRTWSRPCRDASRACALRLKTRRSVAVTFVRIGRYPASYYTGPVGTSILLPPNDGYPATGVWIGEASGKGLRQVHSREQHLGRKFNIVSIYAPHRCDPWPTALAAAVSAGYIPMVSWFPTPFSADAIISGRADSCIKSFGNAIASQPGRVLVRPYWEFNDGSQPFSKDSNGTRATADEERQMWQHTIDVLRTTNFFSKASVVWSPGEGYYNNGDAWNNPTPYPGDSYVDWVASDSYNFDSSSSWCGLHAGWCTFAEAFTHGSYAPTYTPRGVEHDFRGRKPYLVAETGSLEDPNSPGRKGQWMIDMGSYAKTYMPDLYAIVYFDAAYNGKNWNLDSSTSSMNGFKTFAHDPYFNVPNG